ncbi:MAG: TIM barrel protein [Candidatus Altiarchaeales archaeon]|nr:TIM barrel protein [Candidatus Altiarchaeales archaeon]
MRISAMNNPRENLLQQIKLFGELGFEAFELTLEYPKALPEKIELKQKIVRDLIEGFGFGVLAHLPWFFEATHPYDSVRNAYFQEIEKAFRICRLLGVNYVTIHPDIRGFGRSHKKKVESLKDSLGFLSEKAGDYGLVLGVENMDEKIMPTDDLFDVINSFPDLGFTLDVGHANLGVNDTKHVKHLIRKFRKKLRHVHLHDNKGVSDDHLPLGAGYIDWRAVVDCLKRIRYNEAITLEVHATDSDLLGYSKDKLKSYLDGV